MSIESFMSVFTALFNFMRASGITVGGITFTIMDFYLYMIFAAVVIRGLVYIMKGE